MFNFEYIKKTLKNVMQIGHHSFIIQNSGSEKIKCIAESNN